ncbi:MAG: HlyD family efflux transporter periplasmic adaptor subunit [Polaromonas sp.]|uniref:HlyD family secretion protein n=1 Tax=Polaromonas sp. TaxID=1869339 RepID=UPI0017C8435C|nr:HlyD family efflux transporter periplasmic adaptor subunit [Polaromonas sp.]NMM10036.1 HlyD family efflux transporter periplasmic adaptor subunit [Polaromonas sp.]
MTSLKTCCALLFISGLVTACQPKAEPGWSGYVEGDYVYVSSSLGGTLLQLNVRTGDQARQDLPLFALEAENEQAARLEAGARLARANAQLANADKGKRRDEIAVIEAQMSQAREQARLNAAALAREEQLVKQGFVSAAHRDELRAAQAQSAAHLDELAAQLRVGQLPARVDERTAAVADTEAARQSLRQSAWREAQKSRTAPASGLVTDTFFRVGESVQPGQPVLALLPPGNVKARFFVPEGVVGHLQIGAAVHIICDGCAAPIPARISFISNRAEYTPPVIYSNTQRAKLVFMVEARPSSVSDGARLKPGQPVDVVPVAGAVP